jgi:hypothetical protein
VLPGEAHTEGMREMPEVPERWADGAVATDWEFPSSCVPDVDPQAQVDPHWLELRGSSILPPVYMPPVMPGTRKPWTRAIALILIAIFVGATVAGVCLTYGAPRGSW